MLLSLIVTAALIQAPPGLAPTPEAENGLCLIAARLMEAGVRSRATGNTPGVLEFRRMQLVSQRVMDAYAPRLSGPGGRDFERMANYHYIQRYPTMDMTMGELWNVVRACTPEAD